jgi:hypothetical protein
VQLPPDPRRAYISDEPADTEARRLKHELVTEAKRAIEKIGLLDPDETPLEDLKQVVEAMRELADRLEPLPSLSRFGGLASSRLEDATLKERSGISGLGNPIAPPLHFWSDGETTRGRAVWTALYEGPPGCLHGGFVAAAFDDLMGFAQMASGIAGYTGTLKVKMRRPTPLYRPIDYEAGLGRVEGRKIVVWGRARVGDELLSEAEILFVSPRDGSLRR